MLLTLSAHRISKCAFDGSCDAPDVLLKELSKARQADWKKVLASLQALAHFEDGLEHAGVSVHGGGVGEVEGEETEEEVRVVLQDLLQQAREEEGKRVREKTESQYQQRMLQQLDKSRLQQDQVNAQVCNARLFIQLFTPLSLAPC